MEAMKTLCRVLHYFRYDSRVSQDPSWHTTVPEAVQISRSSSALCTIWEWQIEESKTDERSCSVEIPVSFHGLWQKPPLPLKDKADPTLWDVKPQQN